MEVTKTSKLYRNIHSPHSTQPNTYFNKDFLEVLTIVAKDIEDCTFMAIDGEFTGLETERMYFHSILLKKFIKRYSKIQKIIF